LLPFRVFEFSIGGLVTRIEATSRLRLNGLGTAAGVTLIVAAYILFDDNSGFPSFPALLPCLGAALIILCGANAISGCILANRLAVYLGRRSYSLYLVHWPLAAFYTYVANPWTWRTGIWLAFASLPISELLYRFIETPFRYVSGARPSDRIFFLRLAIFTILVMLISATAASTGWPWRLGDRAAAYLQLKDGAVYGGEGCGNQCDTHPGEPVSGYLIGDSNAQQYLAGLRVVFPDTNFRIYQFSSCPFFSLEFTRDFADHNDPKLYDDGCRESRRAAFSEILHSRATVIVSQSWANFPLVSEITGRRLAFPDFASEAPFIADQLVNLIREIDTGSLLIIGTIPGAYGLADCEFRPLGKRSTCEKSSPDLIRLADNMSLMAALAGRAAFINPFDPLCDKSSCKMIDGTLLVYSDPNHLTKHGAELVLRSFRQDIEKALWEPRNRH
jgi:hypothetical protein